MGRRKNKMLRGFARVHLENPDGTIALERTMENQFCDVFRNELLSRVGGGGAFSASVSAIGVGTGGAITGSSTSLPGEQDTASDSDGQTIAADCTVAASSRLRVTGQFASNKCMGNISNMGLHSSTAASALICGNTFSASFAKASNQTLSVTYDITFSS